MWSFIEARGWPDSLYCHSGSFFFSPLLAPDVMQVILGAAGRARALYNTHSSSQFAVATDNRKILQMSLISQTKVLLVNIFFRNMIRLNKFHHDCQCLKIKFSLKAQMTRQHVLSSPDLSRQCSILTGHCPLTGRYFKPWSCNLRKQVGTFNWNLFKQVAKLQFSFCHKKWGKTGSIQIKQIILPNIGCS